MANEIISMINPQTVGDASTSAKVTVGTRAKSKDGKEFIYLKQVTAAAAAGSVVTYDSSSQATLLAANAKGPVAVAMGTVAVGSFAWYQVGGWNTAVLGGAAGTSTDGGLIKYSTSSGKVGGASAANSTNVANVIQGAVTSGTIVASANTIHLNDPVTWDEA